MSNIKSLYACNFCGKNQTQVKTLISQNNTFICSECVILCMEVITPKEDIVQMPAVDELTPRAIVNYLDDHVIGQNEAKKSIAVAIYNHIKRIRHPVIDGVTIDKSNILMIGSSGVGKTHMVKTLAQILNVPFAVVDATSLSQTGYVGLDPEECLARLFQAAENDMAQAEKGIIFIDEVDKIGRKGENMSTTRDVSGEGVQQALLKIIEGSDVKFSPVGGRKNPQGEFVTMNTRNVLFILGGAFEGLERLIERRAGSKSAAIGFNSMPTDPDVSTKGLLQDVQTEDLISFGMIPELIGRIPVLLSFEDLSAETLRRILVEPKNSIVRQFEKMFELDGVKLVFEPEALDSVAQMVLDKRTGARGLRSVIERTLRDSQFDLPSLKQEGVTQLVVSQDNVLNQTQPTRVLTQHETTV